nr:sequestosome-1 [Megalopta genalis]
MSTMYFKAIFVRISGVARQIRKFEHPSYKSHPTFDELCNKVKEMCPQLSDKDFTLSWIDKEGDSITMCNNEELSIAIKQTINETFKNEPVVTDAEFTFYVKCDVTKEKTEISETIVHSNIICDNCNETIVGFRYKCIQCINYDLCMQCEKSGLHAHHWMIRLLEPVTKYGYLLDYINRAVRKSGLHCADSDETILNNGWNKGCRKSCIRHLTSALEAWEPYINYSNKVKVETNNGDAGSSKKVPEQQNTKPEQNGTTSKQNATTPEQNETAPKQNSTTPEQTDVISELKKIPINRILECSRNYLEQLLDGDIITPQSFLADGIEPRENSKKLRKEDQLTTDTTANEASSVPDDTVMSHKNTTSPVNTLTDEWTIIDKNDASGISSASSVSSNLNVSAENSLPMEPTAPMATTATAAPLITSATASTGTTTTAAAATTSVTTSATATQKNTSQKMYPELPIEQRTYHPNPKIHYAIANMVSMGFSNNGGVLTRLLESENGDINSVLDILQHIRS